jgi:hypothetical protein
MVLPQERSSEAIFLRHKFHLKPSVQTTRTDTLRLQFVILTRWFPEKNEGHIVQWLSNQMLCYVGIISVLHFHYVLSAISRYRMTSVLLFLAEAWISLFTSATWLAVGPTGFPIDSAMGKENGAWTYHLDAVSRQIFLTFSFPLPHTSSWVCVQGSTVSTFEVAVKTVISKVGDDPVEAASG